MERKTGRHREFVFSYYALYAYKCGQFDRFLDLLPQMGWVNHPYFGGEERFAEMVADAEQKTGRKAKLPK